MSPFWNAFEKVAKLLSPSSFKLLRSGGTEIKGTKKLLSGAEYKTKMKALAKQRAAVRKAKQVGLGAVKKTRTGPTQAFSPAADRLAKEVHHGGRKYIDIPDRKG